MTAAAPPMIGLRGIVPSLNTPFTADDRVDGDSLRRMVDHVAEAGCAGMLLLAVAGESQSLGPDEQVQVVETVMNHNAGRLPAIVGVTAPRLSDSLERAGLARRHGATAVLWQPPAGLDEAGLEDGLVALGEAGPGPVMLQDLDWHGGGLPVEMIARLFARVPAFRAIKIETAMAGPKYTAVLEATGGALHVSGGWAVGQMMDALARNVTAFMPTGLERVYCEIYRRFQQSRTDRARALFDALLPVLAFSNQHIDVSIRFFKYLRRVGGVFSTDRCRPPVPPLDPVQLLEAEHCARLALELEAGLGKTTT